MSSMMLRVPATRYEGLENPDEGRDRGNKSFDVVDVVLASLSRRLFSSSFAPPLPTEALAFLAKPAALTPTASACVSIRVATRSKKTGSKSLLV